MLSLPSPFARALKRSRPSHRARPSIVRRAAMVAVVAVVAATSFATVESATAADAQTTFSAQSFTGPTITGVLKPTAPGHTNAACLTAGNATTGTPVPGCSTTAIDASGSGALRLTDKVGDQEGGVGATQSVPISKGLDTVFDSYQYGGNSADGIVFYLSVTDPYNPAVPTTIGAAGGSLGYSAQQTTSAGLANGYLGLGIDVYGNYYNTTFGGTGCTGDGSGSGTIQPSVAVRGPGNLNAGYCLLTKNNIGASGNPDSTQLHGTTRANSDVPVEVVINSSTVAAPSSGFGTKLTSVSVPAGSYAIVYKPIGQAQQMLTGTLPTYTKYSSIYSGKSSWFDPTTGYPYKLTYGWVASTGGSNDVHEVNQFTAQTVSGPVPALTATSSVDTATPATGATGTYTVTPTVSSTGGSEAEDVVVTTTFPTGTTPPAYGTTGTAVGQYTCTTSAQVVSCTYPSSAQNVAAGTALPALALPYKASGAATTSGTISSTVSSVDATTVTTSQAVTIRTVPTTTTVTASPTSSTSGAPVTFTATVTPGAGGSLSGTSTVTFTDTTTGTVLCSNATVTSGGTASCTTSALTPTTHTITASYSGNSAVAASSGTTTETVSKIASSGIAVAASPATFGYGATTTLTASGIAAGATGSVTFTAADGSILCTTTISSGTTASCTSATSLAVGSYAVTANYLGDSTHSAASSSTTPVTVTKATRSLTATADGVAKDSVVYGTPATLSVSGLTSPTGATAPTGTITYTDADGKTLCVATLPKISCATSATLASGAYTVTATYSGDANYASAVSTTAQLTVTPQPAATLTPGAGPGSDPSITVQHSGTTTFTTSGLAAGSTGTLTYRTTDGTVLCTVADVTGGTSCETAIALDAGSYTVVVDYSGDANHDASTSAADIALTVTKATSSIAATVDGSTTAASTFGTSVSLAATGLAKDATGTVTFSDQNGVELWKGSVADLASAATPAALAAGSHTITATYSGDGNHTAATAETITLDVARATTHLTATADDKTVDTIVYGSSPTLDSSGFDTGASTTATGTVTYREGTTVLCTATLPDTSCDGPDDLAAGDHTVTATYSGDSDHAAATSDAITITVVKATTDVTATVNDDDSATVSYGTAATLGFQGLAKSATGTVTFTDQNGDTLWTGDVSELDDAATALDLAAGTYTISALYSGDANHEKALAADVTLTVKRANVDVTVADPSDTVYGTPTTLSVGPLPAGATGTVKFVDSDGTVLCTATLPATSCSTPDDLGAGTHSITAEYSGDANHAPATDGPVTLTVSKAPSQVGTGSTSSPAPVSTTHGTPTTFTPTGLPAGATGTVEYRDQNGDVLCTVDLTAGETSCTTDADLGGGSYTVTPVYSGDADHSGSSGAPITFTVAAQAIRIGVKADASSTTWGDSSTLHVTGLPADASGTVTFRDGSVVLCTVMLPTLTCTTDRIEPGTATITASYSGSASYQAVSATTKLAVKAIATVDPKPVASSGRTTITATWPAIPGAAGYRIIVSTSKDLTDAVTTVRAGRDATSIAIDGLDAGTTYYYRVVAVGADGTVLGTHDAIARTASPSAVAAIGQLAFTGSPLKVSAVVGSGILLMVLGGLAIVFGRRRREAR